MLRSALLPTFGMTVAAVLLLLPHPAEAGGVVGNGHAIDCQQSVLTNRLAGGGLVTFDCGPDPVAITLTSPKVITLPTTIDGGHAITLDGVNNTGLFQVNAGASLDLKNITLARGNAVHGGAIISSGSVTIEYSTLRDNSAASFGGAINSDGVLIIRASTLSGNRAPGSIAGAIENQGDAVISDSSFFDNVGGVQAGAIDNGGQLTIRNTSFSNSYGSDGGAILNAGRLTVTASSFVSNSAVYGGGIDNWGLATISETTFLSNTAPNGGALFNYLTGHLALGNDTLMSNMGVSISNTGLLTVTGSTLAGNQGGGIGNLGLATVINSTFSGNSGGAGLKNIGSANILNTTIAGNAGGGLFNGSFNFIFIANTLLAGNGANNCMGTITSLGHNLEDGNTCGLAASGDITGTNPLLLPLANNGGPTRTRALLPGSRAINAGDNSGCPATDQRGTPRIGNCDIGAFESFYRLFLPLLRK
jgi:predicted outer membrane repeat protein